MGAQVGGDVLVLAATVGQEDDVEVVRRLAIYRGAERLFWSPDLSRGSWMWIMSPCCLWTRVRVCDRRMRRRMRATQGVAASAEMPRFAVLAVMSG